MKLKVFHADDGDCLLLTSSDGHHALIDGGRTASFVEQTWGTLQGLSEADVPLDLVVISHVDADHMAGIFWLLKAVKAWTVFDHQRTRGNNPDPKPPKMARPPVVKKLWHNAWLDQMADLAGPIEALVAQVPGPDETVGLDLSNRPAASARFEALQQLGESIQGAIDLRRLVDDETPIPRNEPFKKLVKLQHPPHVERVGRTSLTVLGPSEHHLKRLREEWRKHLAQAQTNSRPAPAAPRGGDELANALVLRRAERDALLAALAQAAEIIVKSDPSEVTPPNRASITLLAEEKGRTCLLTGDAAEEELLDGLRAAGRITAGRFACNVLKVQHHGAEFNLSRPFAETVVAEHYVFCANGASGNPDPSVVKTIAETRLAVDPSPFTLWFNCSPQRTSDGRRPALKAAIREAEAAAAANPQVTVNVLGDDQAFFELTV